MNAQAEFRSHGCGEVRHSQSDQRRQKWYFLSEWQKLRDEFQAAMGTK